MRGDAPQSQRQVDSGLPRVSQARRVEFVEDRVGNEARARREDVPIAEAALLANEEAKGMNQAERVLGPRHRDIEKPPLFLDLGRTSVAKSEGMQPSAALRTNTVSHSWPLAEWMVEQDQVVFVG